VLRLAHASDDDVLAELDNHHDEYPVSASISMSYSNDGSSGTYSFHYHTASMATVASNPSSSSGNSSLLMLALDHHLDAGLKADGIIAPMYSCIKGTLTVVLGRTWTMTEPLTNITYYVPNLGNINATETEAIRQALLVGGWALAPSCCSQASPGLRSRPPRRRPCLPRTRHDARQCHFASTFLLAPLAWPSTSPAPQPDPPPLVRRWTPRL
jgi:hypothetical protein